MACLKTFVSEEHAGPELRMPKETRSKFRIVDRNPKPEERPIITNDGKHLQNIWR